MRYRRMGNKNPVWYFYEYSDGSGFLVGELLVPVSLCDEIMQERNAET